MDKKKIPKKHIILLFCSAVMIIVNIVFYSLGWFTMNRETVAEGVGMKATDTFIVRPTGTTEKKYVTKIYQRLDDYLNSQGMDEQSKGSVVWTLYGDSNVNNTSDGEYQSTRPGSSGQLKFEVEITEDTPVYLEFDFSLIPWSELVESETTTTTESATEEHETTTTENNLADNITEEIQEAAEPYLNTHIMLFNEKDENGYYSGRITPGEKYKCKQPFSKGKTTVTIYWVWPETLGNMILKSNDNNLIGKPIFADESDDRKKLLGEIGASDSSYSKYFLTSNAATDVSHFNKVAAAIIAGKDYNIDYYMEAWRQYNKADEAIGNGIRYFILQMGVQEYEHTTEGD